MNFSQLQEKRPGLAHYALLTVEFAEFFERPNLFRSQFGDALVNGDRFGKETIPDENLGQALKVIDGLESLALADIELADGHQGDLVAGLVFENILVFGDGLRDLALVQQFLCGFDVFAFVVSHSRKRYILPGSRPKDTTPRAGGPKNAPRHRCGYASRREKGKSTNRKFFVSRQLSPFYSGNFRAKTWRNGFPRRRRRDRGSSC